MNKQTSELLTILLNYPSRHFSYEELASRFQVSTRSIRNYVQAIAFFLREHEKDALLSTSEKGVAFTGTSADSSFLLSNLIDEDFYLYKLSPEERIHITLLKLLLADEPITLAQIMESFHVSRTTVLKDMEQLRRLALRNSFAFDPSLNRGYLLRAEERQRRRLILKLIRSSLDNIFLAEHSVNIYLRFLYTECDLGFYLPDISRLLLSAETFFDLTICDNYFERTRLCLALMLVRAKKDRFICETRVTDEELKKFPSHEIARWLLRELSRQHSLLFPTGELEFLTQQLYRYNFYNRLAMGNTQDMHLHLAVMNFLHRVGAELSIPIYEDQEMTAQLERHLKDITNAHFQGIRFENEYAGQLMTEYEAYYRAIQKHASILEQYAGYSYNDDILSFILMYIVVSIENYFQDRLLPQVIVVCHTGIGTANFLAQRLKTRFRLHVAAVTSNHKLPEILDKYNFDLVISTISLSGQNINWVKVSPILNDDDVSRLQKQLSLIAAHKRQENAALSDADSQNVSSVFLPHPILRPESIRLDVPCSTWQDAVRMAAEPLILEHAITPQYVQAILDSAQKNGAYFVYCPGVALAHAGPSDGVLKFGVSLIRLKTSVPFGHAAHDPVTYVICLAACQDEPLLKGVLRILDLLSRPELLSDLDCIQDSQLFLQYLLQKEREEINNE